MKSQFRLLAAMLLLVGTALAAPWWENDHDRDKRRHHSAPEPGSLIMLTVTAGTLVGGFAARRRIGR